MQSYFPAGKCFSILSKYWQVSKYTAFIPKKGKNKSKFWIVNLCNGGTKDFVELWEIIHLKIWTHFSIRRMKLQSNLLRRSPLSDDHSSKTTNAESAPANSRTIVTVSDGHLFNATSDHFFVSQMKKAYLKPLKNFIQ